MLKMLACSVVVLAAIGLSIRANPPTTQPATDAAAGSPEQLLNQMLKAQPGTAKPIAAKIDPPAIDRTTGRGGVPVKTPPAALRREGTFIFDQAGRLTRSADGKEAQFTFEADGKTLKDPPVIILPNLKLMTMEEIVKQTNRDVRFSVSGMLTEYRGRNYLLLEKVLVPSEANAQF